MVTEQEEQIAYLIRQTSSPNHLIAGQARAQLLKWGFNPAEPRTATGEWTREASTSKTPERVRADRAREDRQSAAEVAALDAADRAAADEARHHPPRRIPGKPVPSPVAEARRRYRIPANVDSMGGKRGQAGRDLLAATAELASITRRRATLEAQIAHLQDQSTHHGDLAAGARRTLGHRMAAARAALAALDKREATATSDLADARRRWGKKAAAVPEVTKGVRGPGQRYTHGWKPIVVDTLGLRDRPLSREHDGMTYHASHEIGGRGQNPTRITITDWDDLDEAPRVEIATNRIWNDPTNPPDRPFGGYHHPHGPDDDPTEFYVPNHTAAALTPAEVRNVADHLRDLVTIGRSGHKTSGPPPKPTKHSRTAGTIQALIDRGNIDPADRVYTADEELPITYADLLDLLAPHLPAPTPDAKRLRRTVKYGDKDEDNADVHMLLDTSGAEPVIHLGARERETFPWDPTGEGENADYDRNQSSVLSLDAAAELAGMLDHYADAVDQGALQ